MSRDYDWDDTLLRHVHPEPTSGCWIWTAAVSKLGYARIRVGKTNRQAHRISYERFIGTIPSGMSVLHICDVRSCINPDHLYAGTQKDNVRDMMNRGRDRGPVFGNRKKTHCIRGHELTEENIYRDRNQGRHCKTCVRQRNSLRDKQPRTESELKRKRDYQRRTYPMNREKRLANSRRWYLKNREYAVARMKERNRLYAQKKLKHSQLIGEALV